MFYPHTLLPPFQITGCAQEPRTDSRWRTWNVCRGTRKLVPCIFFDGVRFCRGWPVWTYSKPGDAEF